MGMCFKYPRFIELLVKLINNVGPSLKMYAKLSFIVEVEIFLTLGDF